MRVWVQWIAVALAYLTMFGLFLWLLWQATRG